MKHINSDRPDGLRVPFGESVADGRMYEPLTVPLGKACGCICPGCREPLIAKHCLGSDKVAHFAHQPGSDCATGYMTALHKAAVQLILEQMRLYVPDYFDPYTAHDSVGNTHTVAKRVVLAQELSLTSAKAEVALTHRDLPECKVIPDVLAESSLGRLNIEVAVTHFVDNEKLAKLKRLGLATVELDLEDLSRVDFAVLEDVLFKPSDRIRWVYHPRDSRYDEEAQKELALLVAKADQEALEWRSEQDALEAEREAQRQAAEIERWERDAVKRRAKHDELTRATNFRNSSEPEKLGSMLRYLKRGAPPAFLPIDARGGGSFGCRNPTVWQLAILSGLIGESLKKGHHALNVDYALN